MYKISILLAFINIKSIIKNYYVGVLETNILNTQNVEYFIFSFTRVLTITSKSSKFQKEKKITNALIKYIPMSFLSTTSHEMLFKIYLISCPKNSVGIPTSIRGLYYIMFKFMKSINRNNYILRIFFILFFFRKH